MPPDALVIDAGELVALVSPERNWRRLRSVRAEHMGTFSCDLWRLHLDWRSRGGPGPASVVLKRPVNEPGRRGLGLERRFYEMAGEAELAIPRYYGFLPGEDGIVIEDIADASPFDWRAGPTDAHAEHALAALARLHGAPWPRMDWVPLYASMSALEADGAAYDNAWPRFRELARGWLADFVPLGDALVGSVPELLAPLGQPRCLLHGDAHGENIPLRRRAGHLDVVMFDWQEPRRGHPALDVADFLVMSYPTSRRREVEHALVERHATAMTARGAAVPEPWDAYRRGAIHRVTRVVRIADRFPAWAETSLPWVFRRCAAAALDLRFD